MLQDIIFIACLVIGGGGLLIIHVSDKVRYRKIKGEELDRINHALVSTRRSRIPTSKNCAPGRDVDVRLETPRLKLKKDLPIPGVVRALEFQESLHDSVLAVYFRSWKRVEDKENPEYWVYWTSIYVEVL